VFDVSDAEKFCGEAVETCSILNFLCYNDNSTTKEHNEARKPRTCASAHPKETPGGAASPSRSRIFEAL